MLPSLSTVLMSTVDKLGNIRYALHQALTDNRNFIQQDLLQPIE